AACWGLLFYTLFIRSKLNFKNVWGGILLGIPNYFSIYCLLRALETETMLSGATVAANNIGVVALSALLGVFFMKEKLTVKNIIGIVLAIGSILLISIR
ncbi:MAG: EamA family transporter, partial [Flavobacteriales bacterium]